MTRCEIGFCGKGRKHIEKIAGKAPRRAERLLGLLEHVAALGWEDACKLNIIKPLAPGVGEIRDTGSDAQRLFFFWVDMDEYRQLMLCAVHPRGRLDSAQRKQTIIDAALACRERYLRTDDC